MFVTQSILHPHGINVFGSHLIRTEPDYASVRFTVEAVADEPKPSLERANASVESIGAVLTAAQTAPADVRSSRVRLEVAFAGYGEKRKMIGYRASRSFQIFVRDLSKVEELLIAIVDAGGRTINSVNYKSSQMRELRRDAREGAVAAARTKADVFARAAGAEVGRVLHVEDINPDQLSRRSHAPDVDLDGHSEGPTGSGSIVIAGAVMICFAIVHN